MEPQGSAFPRPDLPPAPELAAELAPVSMRSVAGVAVQQAALKFVSFSGPCLHTTQLPQHSTLPQWWYDMVTAATGILTALTSLPQLLCILCPF